MYEPKSKFLVYCLLDPRNGEVRYIGKSSRGLDRPKVHQTATGRRGETHNARWLRQLWEDGERVPCILVLEECESDAQVLAREMVLIALFREAGFSLTNITDGGEGGRGCLHPGYKHTTGAKEAISKRSRQMWASMTPEERESRVEAMSKARRGAKREATPKLLAYWASMKGRKLPPETCAKLSEQLRRRPRSKYTPERRARMAALWTPEMRAKRAEELRIRYEDPEARAVLGAAVSKAKSTPEGRARASAAGSRVLADKDNVSKLVASRWADPGAREKQSEASKKMWEDKERAARMVATKKAQWADPEFKRRSVEAMKAGRARKRVT